MARRHPSQHTVAPLYPISAWEIIETRFQKNTQYRNETIFALGNGTLGTRGTFEEGNISDGVSGLEGTYINGFYESENIRYPEPAYGLAQHSQTMLNLPNGKMIQVLIGDEPFDLSTGTVLSYQRVLNLREGTLARRVQWQSPKGHTVLLDTTRLLSFDNRHLMAIDYTITPLDFDGTIRLVSMINGDVKNLVTENDPRAGSGLQGRVLELDESRAEGEFGILRQHTQHSGMALACAMQHDLETANTYAVTAHSDHLQVWVTYVVDAKRDQAIRLSKYVGYVTTQTHDEFDLVTAVTDVVEQAKIVGFAAILQRQRADYQAFWDVADIEIDGDPALQQGIRFNIFHLVQSVGRDGFTNISAKGVTGEGYEGHYFWDTEMYVIPFFLHIRPDIVRQLLTYRFNILDKARARAREMSHAHGALFPWRTIDGEECSAYFPAGTAQYHINADVAFAIKRYMEVTHDQDFLVNYGAEMLFETARFWVNLGVTIVGKGFCINGVTGPDEYTAIVNNNAYTNLMAQTNLWYASEVAKTLQQDNPTAYAHLVEKLGLDASEIVAWQQAGDSMVIPFDETRQLYKQDDSFFDKAVWDFDNTPANNYPLLLHYHPLVIYRHQVCKQADLILAMFLLGNRFSLAEKQRNYDYYEGVTTHDSSLSSCIFSIVASEIGYHDRAYDYFMMTARMDLDDYHHNVKDGVHIANMAGAWMCLVNGFAGLRVQEGHLVLRPYLPHGWQGYTFKVRFEDGLLKVNVRAEGVTYELLEGAALTLQHGDTNLLLTKGHVQKV